MLPSRVEKDRHLGLAVWPSERLVESTPITGVRLIGVAFHRHVVPLFTPNCLLLLSISQYIYTISLTLGLEPVPGAADRAGDRKLRNHREGVV